MRIDDIRSFLVANLTPFISALSTGPVPLVAIPAGSIWTREYHDAVGVVSLFLDDDDEQAEVLTLSTRLVTLPVTAYLFVMGGTEVTMREQAGAYAQALINCLRTYSYFFQLKTRVYFDGVEGKPGTKAAKLELEFHYEETL